MRAARRRQAGQHTARARRASCEWTRAQRHFLAICSYIYGGEAATPACALGPPWKPLRSAHQCLGLGVCAARRGCASGATETRGRRATRRRTRSMAAAARLRQRLARTPAVAAAALRLASASRTPLAGGWARALSAAQQVRLLEKNLRADGRLASTPWQSLVHI